MKKIKKLRKLVQKKNGKYVKKSVPKKYQDA
ncbi:MAG: hypothetical protein KatS3mg031_2930 [Chitinophagales bacterium]|nr:MAG: hypothetical protein KatS3mg031_2930 [Chitinophagales bacterium]